MDETETDPETIEAEPETTPLMQACQNGDDEKVKELLEQKVSVLEINNVDRTALHYCTENINLNCAEQLIAVEPTLVDMKDIEGYSAMHLAIMSGNKPILEFLIKNNGDVNSEDIEKHSLVHWATVCAQLDCLELLISVEADLSTADSHGAHPIHYAAQMCGYNSELNNDSEMGMKTLQLLLDQNVSVLCTDQDNRQPLLWAASAGSADACEKLIQIGATVSAADKDGLTALHCAASRDHRDCVEKILSEGAAEVDVKDKNGCTPLFYAVTLGHPECTKLLLDKGAGPDLQDKKGRSPAHCGAAKGQLETLKILEQYEGSLWLRNIRGDSPIHEAVQCGDKTLVQYLLAQKPSAVNLANSDGRTPLHIAAMTNNIEMCKLLVENKVDLNSVMKNNKVTENRLYLTALDIAMQKEHQEIIDYLVSLKAKQAHEIVEKSEFVLKDERRRAERQLAQKEERERKKSKKKSDVPVATKEVKVQENVRKGPTTEPIKEEDENEPTESEAGENETENNDTSPDNDETQEEMSSNEMAEDTKVSEEVEANGTEQNENGENENKENEIEEKTELEPEQENDKEKNSINDLEGKIEVINNVRTENMPKKKETIKRTKYPNTRTRTTPNKNVKSEGEATPPVKKEHPLPVRSKTSTSALTRPKTKGNNLNDRKSPFSQDGRPNTTMTPNLKPRPIRQRRLQGGKTNAQRISTLRYEQERRIFQELLEVKRVQILYSRANEEAMVRRLINNYMRRTHYETKEPNVKTLAAWEKWLHDQLRLITMENDGISGTKIKDDNTQQNNRKRKQGLVLQEISSASPARTTALQSPGCSAKPSERLPNINSLKKDVDVDLGKDSSSEDGDFVQGLSISLSSSQSSDSLIAISQVIKRSSKKTPPKEAKHK